MIHTIPTYTINRIRYNNWKKYKNLILTILTLALFTILRAYSSSLLWATILVLAIIFIA